MKKKNSFQKLSLNKVSIVDFETQANVKGGIETQTGCPTEPPCWTEYVGCYVPTETAVSINVSCGGGSGMATGIAMCDIPWK